MTNPGRASGEKPIDGVRSSEGVCRTSGERVQWERNPCGLIEETWGPRVPRLEIHILRVHNSLITRVLKVYGCCCHVFSRAILTIADV